MRPEDYWIGRGNDVIGTDAWEEGDKARQADTYTTIAKEVVRLGCKSVLDVGCNVGAMAKFLRANGYDGEYVGVDSNEYALAVALSHGLVVTAGNLRDLGTLSGECVIVKDVIEHLENILPLQNAFRAAKSVLVLSLFLPLIDGESFIQKMDAGYFHNQYSHDTVVSLAKLCGFKKESMISTLESTGSPNEVLIFRRGV